MELHSDQFVLLKRPDGLPDPSVFGLEHTVLPEKLKKNELRLRGVYFSVDPYMRGRMNEAKSYVAPFALNAPLEGSVVARVDESRSPNFKIGDLVSGLLPWATEMIVSAAKVEKIDTDSAFASEYLGILGMTGLTAYFGLMKIGQPKAGETVVISGAAGAVGTVVGQIAKLKGCRVVGIVGSDEKAKFLKDHFRFDETINYHNVEDLGLQIQRACPAGVDIYFDNVGGEISDAVINNMNFQGRIALCGQISLYNEKEAPVGPRLQPRLLTKSILMQGFIVSNFKSEFAQATQLLKAWLADGKIESSETIIEGFSNLPNALIGLFSGKNVGKMLVKVVH